MFYSTDISVTLWILNQNKAGGEHHGRMLRNRQGEVLFVDLRTWNDNRYNKGKFVQFSAEQIAEISKIYFDWQTSGVLPYAKAELYYAATKAEIAEKNYSLVPSRYIEFVDRDTELDYATALSQSAGVISDLLKRQKENASKLENAFKLLGYEVE
jgi:type I restriction enzyme M protein